MSSAHPDHYKGNGIECIEAIRASMTTEEFLGFCKGNCVKYLWRYQNKDGVDDLEKAGTYLKWMAEELHGDSDDISEQERKFFFGDIELPSRPVNFDITRKTLKEKLDKIIDNNMLKPYGREVKFNIDRSIVDFKFYLSSAIEDEINEIRDIVREFSSVKDWAFTNGTFTEDSIKATIRIDIEETKLINTIFEFLTKKGFSV